MEDVERRFPCAVNKMVLTFAIFATVDEILKCFHKSG